MVVEQVYSTFELVNKGLFRVAFSSAVYSGKTSELEIVTEVYNHASGKKYKSDDLYQVFGVPRIIKVDSNSIKKYSKENVVSGCVYL